MRVAVAVAATKVLTKCVCCRCIWGVLSCAVASKVIRVISTHGSAMAMARIHCECLSPPAVCLFIQTIISCQCVYVCLPSFVCIMCERTYRTGDVRFIVCFRPKLCTKQIGTSIECCMSHDQLSFETSLFKIAAATSAQQQQHTHAHTQKTAKHKTSANLQRVKLANCTQFGTSPKVIHMIPMRTVSRACACLSRRATGMLYGCVRGWSAMAVRAEGVEMTHSLDRRRCCGSSLAFQHFGRWALNVNA